MNSQSDRAASFDATRRLCAEVECVWPARAILGEGCCWDPRTNRVFWVDIEGARLYALSVGQGSRQMWTLPCRLGSVAVPTPHWLPPVDLGPDPLLACGDLGLMWLGLRGPDVEARPIANPEGHLPGNRFNDGKMGPDGRYWAGTMDQFEARASGSLYAFSNDGSVTRLDSGYRVTNGPAFSPDGRVVYHADSALRVVYAFDLAPRGLIENKHVLVQFAPGEGCPDGMTTDAQGNLWIAIWDGSRIEKISAQGERIGHIQMPTSRVTSCAFIDPNETVMYVTSARVGLPDTDRLAGGLLKVTLAAL